ncbi:MAG: hypothetical protein KGD67_08310 [Candidatus Lokiarchaeota archaeon]|nr:hypothetical protein [Candidatus Lokiarchaeota archaeon]
MPLLNWGPAPRSSTKRGSRDIYTKIGATRSMKKPTPIVIIHLIKLVVFIFYHQTV